MEKGMHSPLKSILADLRLYSNNCQKLIRLALFLLATGASFIPLQAHTTLDKLYIPMY